jgi:hypothetical protein
MYHFQEFKDLYNHAKFGSEHRLQTWSNCCRVHVTSVAFDIWWTSAVAGVSFAVLQFLPVTLLTFELNQGQRPPQPCTVADSDYHTAIHVCHNMESISIRPKRFWRCCTSSYFIKRIQDVAYRVMSLSSSSWQGILTFISVFQWKAVEGTSDIPLWEPQSQQLLNCCCKSQRVVLCRCLASHFHSLLSNNYHLVRFEVFTAVTMKNAAVREFLRSVPRLLFTAFSLIHRFLSPSQWRRYVPAKCRFLQESHGVTSEKTAFFNNHRV